MQWSKSAADQSKSLKPLKILKKTPKPNETNISFSFFSTLLFFFILGYFLQESVPLVFPEASISFSAQIEKTAALGGEGATRDWDKSELSSVDMIIAHS